MKTIAKRLKPDQDLLRDINSLAKENSVQAGVVLSAVGSLKEARIRLPVVEGKVSHINPKNLEIVSLSGTVSINGSHLHIAASDEKGRVFGGHLKQGCIIRTTCELVIAELENTTFSRQPNPKTGFDELVIDTP